MHQFPRTGIGRTGNRRMELAPYRGVGKKRRAILEIREVAVIKRNDYGTFGLALDFNRAPALVLERATLT